MLFLGQLTCVKRVRLRTITVSVILLGVIFLVYQVMISSRITDDDNQNTHDKSLKLEQNPAIKDHLVSNNFPVPTIKGILPNDNKYIPNINGNIFCSMDSIEIDVSKINDDYCDCPADGMDEPGTSACRNGRFYCNYQPNMKHCKYYISLPYTIYI